MPKCLLFLLLSFLSSISAQNIGDSKQVLACEAAVKATGSAFKGETRSQTATYSPPTGWYIEQYIPEQAGKWGNAWYTVSNVPQGWNFLLVSQMDEAYNWAIQAAINGGNHPLASEFQNEWQHRRNYVYQAQSSHHALVLTVTAKGKAGWRHSYIHMKLHAKLVYGGTSSDLEQIKLSLKNRLAAGGIKKD